MSAEMQMFWIASVVMFLEYAIWGAWAPVLAVRLLGPLGLSGRQAGWVYSTLPLACIFAPLIAGQLADSFVQIRWLLAGCQLLGGVFLLWAASERRYGPLFLAMLLYSIFYTATMPLVNALVFSFVPSTLQEKTFLWAPVGWALAGYFLTAWRWIFKTEKEGNDCLYLAAALSFIMVIFCALAVPGNEPARAGMALLEAVKYLQNPHFLLFFIVSVVGAGTMQFYFLGSGRFMQDIGISAKNVPGVMAIAQVVQTLATLFLLGWVLDEKVLGIKGTLALGAVCWAALYVIYLLRQRGLVVVSQALHGLAYVFFIIGGWIFANNVATDQVRASMQALVLAATTGVGLFLGTQLAGFVMAISCKEGQYRWANVWALAAVIVLACAIALGVFFNPAAVAPPA